MLLCHASGMGIKCISSAFDISRNTVRRYVRMYQDSGIPAEKLPSLSLRQSIVPEASVSIVL
ncbi:helix-turn-helix domain-containing protein, partial [Duncaniella muris]|uniref:helix-turn-helix domain-containing protein n=1 Tax=Duncaniella muris TaxID=2094150 RepID=UPI0025A5134B